MAARFPEAEIVGYQHLVGTLDCLDPEDEHVLGAAIIGRAASLVTFNLKDFPSNTTQLYGVEVTHPDDFLMNLADKNPQVFLDATSKWCAGYQSPALSVGELSEAMRQLGCPNFAKYLLFEGEAILSRIGN